MFADRTMTARWEIREAMCASRARTRRRHIVGNAPVADYVSYTSLGFARLRTARLQMGTFSVCSPRQRALHVVLANSGRVRIDRTTIPCP